MVEDWLQIVGMQMDAAANGLGGAKNAVARNGSGIGVIETFKFEARIKELIENIPDLVGLVESLLIVQPPAPLGPAQH